MPERVMPSSRSTSRWLQRFWMMSVLVLVYSVSMPEKRLPGWLI